MQTVSQSELEFAADVRRRDADSGKVTNEERSRAECIEFRANPPAGSYLAYLTENKEWREHLGTFPPIGADGREATRYKITTFMGDTLADVTAIRTRKVRGSPLTDERGSFWARGIDGRMYHGRHNGAGVYCRMRPAKNQ